MTATEIQAALTEAGCAGCYTNASMADLLKIGLLSQISAVAGTGAGAPVCANYGGGNPTFVPASGCAVAIDTSTGQVFWYYNGTWN